MLSVKQNHNRWQQYIEQTCKRCQTLTAWRPGVLLLVFTQALPVSVSFYTVHSLPQVSVVPTPGHTGQDVSVQVKGVSAGIVLVAGDLFECCSDEDSWRDLSMNTAVQEVNRKAALRTADIIIPGHGLPFRVLRSWWTNPGGQYWVMWQSDLIDCRWSFTS